ncbi:hypothetical protein HBH74_205520 [Parastagonospora nodorum]|nr:hypothetical protein HBI05_225080 [Parastagonospora nodorum]KAH4892768.1 hypothetical protein HBH74_205520 [Parastagonospora nodorum]
MALPTRERIEGSEVGIVRISWICMRKRELDARHACQHCACVVVVVVVSLGAQSAQRGKAQTTYDIIVNRRGNLHVNGAADAG